MRKILSSALLLLTSAVLLAQTTLGSGITVSHEQALGLDRPYDLSPVALSDAPEGFEPYFIEHYGRHGSRYAYSEHYYTDLHGALERGAANGVLTPFGKELAARYEVNYQRYRNRCGDLTPLGREQQMEIAKRMYRSFPEAFRGGKVFATASMSIRSIMSMSAFCLGLCSVDPRLPIVEEQGRIFLNGTNPRDGKNPFAVRKAPVTFPYDEDLETFQKRKFDSRRVLSRLFTDVDAALGKMTPEEMTRSLYVLVAGMASIPAEERTDFSGLFTEEEFARMWEVDDYRRFCEYYNYPPYDLAVVQDIVADAERRIAAGERGACLRFGHDHVTMPVLGLLGVGVFKEKAPCPDELSKYFPTYLSPMATNIQIVFYKPVKGDACEGNLLVKVLHNGREVPLAITPWSGFYYRWTDLKAWCKVQEDKYPMSAN